MPDTVNIHEAKTHLSRLLERVRRGVVITIAKAGVPVARLVPIGRAAGVRQVGEAGRASAPGADRVARLRRFLEQEVWPTVPPGEDGRRLSREEEDDILGYGTEGM